MAAPLPTPATWCVAWPSSTPRLPTTARVARPAEPPSTGMLPAEPGRLSASTWAISTLADANAAEALSPFSATAWRAAMHPPTRSPMHAHALVTPRTAATRLPPLWPGQPRAAEVLRPCVQVNEPRNRDRGAHYDGTRADGRRQARRCGARGRCGGAAGRGAGADPASRERAWPWRAARWRACGVTRPPRCSVFSRSPIRATPAPKWQRERMRAWVQIGLGPLEQGAAENADRVIRACAEGVRAARDPPARRRVPTRSWAWAA